MRTLLFYRNFDQVATDPRYKPDRVNFTLKWQPWVFDWFDNPVFYGMNPDCSCFCFTVSNWDQFSERIPECYWPVAILWVNPDGSYRDSFCETNLPDGFFPVPFSSFIYSDID